MNVYHPALWGNRSYLCCGSTQRSTSKATNGCRSVTWAPNTLQHMGINFSNIIHHPSPSPSPVAKTANGAEVEATMVKPTVIKPTAEIHPAIVGDVVPASPSTSHNAVVALGTMSSSVSYTSLVFPLVLTNHLHKFIISNTSRKRVFVRILST